MMKLKYLLFLFFICLSAETVLGQAIEIKLEEQTVSLERDIARIYNELQKFLHQDSRRGEELLAFEALISMYVDQVLDLYDTFFRIRGTTLESQQNTAARCLIFRALTYLERADEAPANYKKACNDYKRALHLAQNELREPLLSTKLPHEIWVGRKLYTRLADLLDNRSKNFQMIDCFRVPEQLSSNGRIK